MTQDSATWIVSSLAAGATLLGIWTFADRAWSDDATDDTAGSTSATDAHAGPTPAQNPFDASPFPPFEAGLPH